MNKMTPYLHTFTTEQSIHGGQNSMQRKIKKNQKSSTLLQTSATLACDHVISLAAHAPNLLHSCMWQNKNSNFFIFFIFFFKNICWFFFVNLSSCRRFIWRNEVIAGWTGDRWAGPRPDKVSPAVNGPRWACDLPPDEPAIGETYRRMVRR